MKEYQIGQILHVRPCFLPTLPDGGPPPKLPAKVVYVHPKGRYITAEFTSAQFRGVRECYFPEELEVDS